MLLVGSVFRPRHQHFFFHSRSVSSMSCFFFWSLDAHLSRAYANRRYQAYEMLCLASISRSTWPCSRDAMCHGLKNPEQARGLDWDVLSLWWSGRMTSIRPEMMHLLQAHRCCHFFLKSPFKAPSVASVQYISQWQAAAVSELSAPHRDWELQPTKTILQPLTPQS